MKLSTKILAVAFVVAIALTVTTVAGAAGYQFSNSLTIGSTGADVTALQTALISGGYLTMPAGVSQGYFGALTKAAVVKFQVANGITPAVGYFGPITRAAFNNAVGAGTVSTTVGGCAVGAAFSATTGAPCTTTTTVAGCAAGAMFSATTGASCTGSTVVSQNGTDGTLSQGVSSYVSSGITLKKGDTKDILATNLKASVGPVTLTRVAVHFNARPWLVLSQVTLHDSTGKVLATKSISSSNDATEITVGSDYLVDFGNVNYTVTPGQSADLAVGVTVLSATDKITGSLAATNGFSAAFDPIRTINGIGWTDSVGSYTGIGTNQTLGTTGASSNTVTLLASGSIADINARISPNSPATEQVSSSLTQTTSGVVLGTFSLKSANNPSTLNTLSVTIASTSLQQTVSGVTTYVGAQTAFSNVRLFNGSNSYGGTLASNGVVTFSNLTIPLTQDNWQDYTVKADVAQGISGTVTVSLTATTANIVVTDANYNSATVNGGVSVTSTSNPITFTTNSVTVTNTSATLTALPGTTNTGYNATYAFTITNTSNNQLYVSATSTILASQTATNGLASSSLSTIQTVTPSSLAGDSATSYVVPAGSSRAFVLFGVLHGVAGGQAINLKVTQINYGTVDAIGTVGQASTNAQYNINFGLQNLSATGGF